MLSVCGGKCKNIKELIKLANSFYFDTNFSVVIESYIKEFKEKINFLEIGFGYGNIFQELKDKCNYYGIDYTVPDNLKKYKNFIEIDKSGIPDYLINEEFFDIIYSVNVLQHCSQKDRFEYFEQGYKTLKKGGIFIFTANVMADFNKKSHVWGFIDKKGRGYTHFFNQLTECDYDYEFFDFLKKIGYKVLDCKFARENILLCILTKP